MGDSAVSDYCEYPLSPTLAPYLACLWVQTIGDGATAYPSDRLPLAAVS